MPLPGLRQWLGSVSHDNIKTISSYCAFAKVRVAVGVRAERDTIQAHSSVDTFNAVIKHVVSNLDVLYTSIRDLPVFRTVVSAVVRSFEREHI